VASEWRVIGSSAVALQGHLMMYREDPDGAVASAPDILP
jgi:hypothetical protein